MLNDVVRIMKSVFFKLYLCLAGCTLIAVGRYLGLSTNSYLSQYLPSLVSGFAPFSELDGVGGTLYATGIFTLCGTFLKKLSQLAFVVSILVMVVLSLYQTVDVFVEGLPNSNILLVFAVELVFSLIALAFLAYFNLVSLHSRSVADTSYNSSRH